MNFLPWKLTDHFPACRSLLTPKKDRKPLGAKKTLSKADQKGKTALMMLGVTWDQVVVLEWEKNR